jgi:hypothetical protein
MAINFAAKGQTLRLLRTVHTWLGAFIFPWIVIIGATGFYLNHARPILSVLEGAAYAESRFDEWQGAQPVSQDTARAVAMTIWPDEPVQKVAETVYHDRPSFEVTMLSGKVIVTRPTGHYFVKTANTRRTYSPDGELLHSKIYWGAMFKRLHRDGWLGGGLGTWLADITSISMVVFGLTGAFLWWLPRSRRVWRAVTRRN